MSLIFQIIILAIVVILITSLILKIKRKPVETFLSNLNILSSLNISDPLSNITSPDTSSASAVKDYIGTDYNYIQKIKTPKKLKVSSKPNLFALPPDFKAVQHYVKTLVKGNPPLGNSFFIKSGTCNKDTSVSECKGKDRWIYINNKSTGLVPCTDYKSPYKGLVPGFIEDVSYLNPYEIFKNISGLDPSYSTACILRSEPVGSGKKRNKETKCSVPSSVPACLPSF